MQQLGSWIEDQIEAHAAEVKRTTSPYSQSELGPAIAHAQGVAPWGNTTMTLSAIHQVCEKNDTDCFLTLARCVVDEILTRYGVMPEIAQESGLEDAAMLEKWTSLHRAA